MTGERSGRRSRPVEPRVSTESEGYVLGACTKGPGGGTLRSQPLSSIQAPGRAFALKPSFTLNLLLDAERKDMAELRELEGLQINYKRFVDGTVGAMAEEVGVAPSSAKDWAARVVRKGVAYSEGKDIEALGLTVRVPRVDPNLLPYRTHLVPKLPPRRSGERGLERQPASLLHRVHALRACYGPHTRDASEQVHGYGSGLLETDQQGPGDHAKRMDQFQRLDPRRPCEDFPTAASTKAIHVRTKGRDSTDLDELPDGTRVTKKAFWLNAAFVQELLHRGMA